MRSGRDDPFGKLNAVERTNCRSSTKADFNRQEDGTLLSSQCRYANQVLQSQIFRADKQIYEKFSSTLKS